MSASAGLEGLISQLQLADDQQQKLAQLLGAASQSLRQGMMQEADYRQQIAGLDATAADFEQQLDNLIEQLNQTTAANLRQEARLRQAVYAVLDTRQQQQLTQLQADARQHRPGPGDGMGRPPQMDPDGMAEADFSRRPQP
ncbi:hypothetical protein [Oceanobacter mangrovi]|uniref:hypothetical protein n=1 Tax=Oceanobacter mangrovi TaxID=2862510 RepID=UPI001C8DF2A5|nr:hypothetical protein [Oceanobacter mangrovi]